MTTANVLRGCAAAGCHRTFHGEHGGSLPGGPFPGTSGEPGDVRRCDHGNVWAFATCEHYRIDTWRRLSRFWEPIQYRRAVAALSTQPETPGGRPGSPE